MNRFLLAVILIFGVSGAMAQTFGNPTFNSLTLVNPMSGAGVAFTPPGQAPESLQARGLFQSFVGDFGASGSSQTTTGAITSGSTSLTLVTALDFQNGQAVLVPAAGVNFSAAHPTATASVVGSTGSTTACYDVASIDAAGGVGVPVQTCVTTGNATLTAQNHNSITITPGGGSAAHAVWKGPSTSGPWTYIGSGQATTYTDTGYVSANRPWWIPAFPPASAQNDWLVAKIVSGGATTALTLAKAAANAVSGAAVRHDDTAAINAALSQSAGARVSIPCGNYNTSGSISFAVNYVWLIGDGKCAQINPSGTSDIFSLQGTSSANQTGNNIENLYVNGNGSAAGYSINCFWCAQFDYSQLEFDNVYSGVMLTNYNRVTSNFVRVIGFYGQQGVITEWNTDATHLSNDFDGINTYGVGIGGPRGDLSTGQTAYLIDGGVQTVVARNFSVSDTAGSGLVASNVVGNSSPPQFLFFHDFQSEYSVGRGVDLEAGLKFYFINGFTHAAGWGNYTNCAAEPGFSVANGVQQWQWIGGDVQAASGDGIYINSNEGLLEPQNVTWNSDPIIGGTAGQCPGVEFGASAQFVVLHGATIGDSINPSWQAEPILLDSGASNIDATHNVLAGDVSSTILDNSGSATNILAPNANDTAPGWAFDHVDQLFGIGTGATFSANNSRPGEIIREANSGGVVQLTVQNTGSGAAAAALQFTTSNTANSNANLKMNNNSGTNPSLTLAIGSGVSGGASFDASGGGSTAPFALKGGSAAGVTANPFIDLVNAYTVATLPSCTSSLAGALACVTDASSPTYNSSLTGGSSVKALALCNGSVWTAH